LRQVYSGLSMMVTPNFSRRYAKRSFIYPPTSTTLSMPASLI